MPCIDIIKPWTWKCFVPAKPPEWYQEAPILLLPATVYKSRKKVKDVEYLCYITQLESRIWCL